jgi:hypothetical protein
MTDLSNKRCYNHADREAVALCLDCSRFFCRECITEHEDRVVCASCLSNITKEEKKKTNVLSFILRPVQVVLGVLALWILFYVMGQGLLALPSSFHEGSVWQSESSSP